MSKEQREAFLADLHVGVISIERADAAPLSVPIWYRYFGESLGDMYVKDNTVEGQSVFVMRPEKWLTVDYGNMQDA
jgi:nitroimidazol reductase NimA-like FMN-containing flavoprotein (pyridoxamine 5'-phosphate oxidase superfamily)